MFVGQVVAILFKLPKKKEVAARWEWWFILQMLSFVALKRTW